MKLYIKQKAFSWTDSFTVCDEQGTVCYTVKADWPRLGHQLYIYDAAGQEVGLVSEKLLTWLPVFEISKNGRTLGSVRREWSFLRPRYTVDYKDWQVQGEVFGWEYTVSSRGRQVATICKELFTWTDSYVIETAEEQDAEEVLMLVIAIDAANCKN